MRSELRKVSLLIATFFVSLTMATSYAQAKSCHPFGTVTGWTGKAVKKDNAKRNARIHWRTRVRGAATLGVAFTNWGIATERSYSCHKKWGRWRCKATARPCRP